MTTLNAPRKPKTSVRARPLIWGLFLYAGWYALCAVVALWRAAHLRGEPYIPSQGDSYTATIEIWPGALQPLGTLLLFTAFLGHLVAMPMVALAVHRLADPEVWAARATWTWLLVGTLSVLGTIVLAFSGPGEMVRNWVMD